MSADEYGIGTYPVGVLADFKHKHLRRGLWYVWRQAKEGHWKAVRNSFNGYLAEWHYLPEGVVMSKCGHGWTRKRARRRLGKYLVRDNLSDQEQERITHNNLND